MSCFSTIFQPGNVLLFLPSFLQIRMLDLIDIILVAILIYYIYKLIRGSGALNIFIGIASIYIFWWLVRLFEMELLTEILGQFISVGVLALIVVFQPEIRKFLLILGTQSFLHKRSRLFFGRLWQMDQGTGLAISDIVSACEELSETRTGALIVLTKENTLQGFLETGEIIDSKVSRQLLENIFYKNSPLHDGAVIIINNRIAAARCVLPVSESTYFPAYLGLRHRAAVGISEISDAIAIVVSEQTGRISWVNNGKMKRNIKPVELKEMMVKEFSPTFDKKKGK
jgi:diadenylate cyclase